MSALPVRLGSDGKMIHPNQIPKGNRPLGKPRGVKNSNERGNAEARRRRRVWLLETYRANVDIAIERIDGYWFERQPGQSAVKVCKVGMGIQACRCYRCGCLLTLLTLTVDRIIPGVKGGTYRRNNLRPACCGCNSETGGALASRKAKR